MYQSRGTQKIKDECTLYVTVKGSKLPDHISKTHILQHFREFNCSITDVEIVHKKDKRYAFIKLTSGDMATAAMRSLQGSMLMGKYVLTINYGQKIVPAAQPQLQPVADAAEPMMSTCSKVSPVIHRESTRGVQHKYSDGSVTASCVVTEKSATVGHHRSVDSGYVICVRVRNSKFPAYIGDSDLRSHFSDFHSNIVDIYIHRNPQTGESCGYGFVIFDTHLAAKTALRQLQGSKLHDKFSLYIRFDGLKRLRSSDTEREVSLQLPFEQLLYLKHCFFVSPTPLSTALMRSLPAKLVLKDECVMLYGTSAVIWKATCLICENPLICNLKSSNYTKTWGHIFVRLLQDSFLNPINEIKRDVLCIIGNKKGDLQHDLMFTVYIFSHDQEILHATVKKLTELKPQSKVFRLGPEYPTMLQLNEAFTSLGKKNCTKIAKESGHGITIHGLRAIDIQNCWLQLKEFIDSRITVTVNIDLGYWQVKFLQQKYSELFTGEEKNECEAKFPSFILPRHQSQSMTVTVTLTGKIRSTKTTSDKIKRFCSEVIIKSTTLHCKTKYIKLWRKRWENIKSEQNLIGILLDFCEMQSESDQVVVGLTVVSNESIQVNKVYNDIILNENGSRERLSKHDVNLSTAQFAVLHDNLSIFQERIEKVHSIIVELEKKSNQKLTLLTLPGNDAALISAEIMLIGLISRLTPQQQPILKELVCKDDITILLFLTAKSIYFTRLKKIADQHSVEVLPIKDEKVLRLRGTETKIKIVEDELNTLMSEVRFAVECTQLAVSKHHYPILSSDEFKKALSEIQQERHILCSHHSRRVLRQALLKSQLDHKVVLQIVVGSLAGEAADAIVVPAGTQDPNMINSEMAESFSKYIHNEGKALNVGDVISLPSGSYPSKLALHVVLPKNKDRKDFILGCWSCIQTAKSKVLKSLSFPVLGVDDQHHFSVDSCINDLLFCIDHLMSKTQASLDKICIVSTDDVAAQVLDCFDKHHFKSQSAVANVQPSPSWCWNDDKGQYSDYPQDISDKLNQAKNANSTGICYFEINSRSYVVDFSKMIQRNIETCHTRKVLCKTPSLKPLSDPMSISGLTLHREACAIKLAVVGSAQWYYRDDSFIFVSFSFQDSAEIESMFQKRIPDKSITIDSRTYNFDFERMKQINVDSGYERDLNREEMAQSNGSILPESELLPKVEYYVNIRGLKIHLRSAKQRIIKQLNKLCASKFVQLPVSSTSDFIQKLTSIARRHQVISLCEDRQAASCQSSSGNKRYINIKGAEQLVHRAVTEIQDEIIKFQSTLTASAVEYPTEWEPCLSTTVMAHLIELIRHSTEWKHVVDKFKETMPSSEIISIKRIQNKWLWEKYAQTKKRMYQKNSGEVNEKELWHGSRRNAESIYDSEEGFDMRFSSDGMWGRANYFATDARYSVKYAYQRDDGTKELLLARVLTGDSYDSSPNKKLNMPPEKPTPSSSEIKLKQVRYDSVTGITNKCRVYMTYSNERAYPAYLVHFSVSPILPPTTASQSTTKSVMALTRRLKLTDFMS